jgi:hypothetical protein
VGQTEEEGDDAHTHQRERVYYSSLYLVISEEKRETKTKNSFHPSNFLFFPLAATGSRQTHLTIAPDKISGNETS